MTTLHLGVLVQSYATGGRTTDEVAEILESKYGLFSAFWETHKEGITLDFENAAGGALESLLMGRAIDPFATAMADIERRFRDFLSTGEAERVGIPGTPTKAALRGVRHRFKHPYRKSNPRRPSFIDTGLLEADFRAWVDAE